MRLATAGDLLAPASLEAHARLPARLRSCSLRAGWRSLLLRGYAEDPVADPFTTQVTSDYLIVLVVDGVADVESRRGSRWVSARKVAGMVGTIRPGDDATLRWRSESAQRTLQLHLPAALIGQARDDHPSRRRVHLPDLHGEHAPFLQSMLRTLASGMSQGLPDLYAEQGATFMAAHLVAQPAQTARDGPAHEARRLARVEALLHDHLSTPVTLARMAAEAGVSRHHLIRLFKAAYGETPFRRLTRIRMEAAARMLTASSDAIAEIASQCGYENATHFSSAFRRRYSVSPSVYRQARSHVEG